MLRMCSLMALMALMALVACGNGERDAAGATPVNAPGDTRPVVRLVALTDLGGTLEPCGCQSRPLGGIDRAAQRLAELAADGVPTLLVSAGDFFFDAAGGHGAHASPPPTQERLEAETLVDIMNLLAPAGVVPGPSDQRFGAPVYDVLAERARFPLLDTRGRIVQAGPLKVGIWGLSRARNPELDLSAEAVRLTRSLRAEGAGLVVGLLSAEPRDARLLAATEGLDFLLVGGRERAEPVPPQRQGAAVILEAGRQGQGLLVLELFGQGPGAYADASEWTASERRRAQDERVASLEKRVATWSSDPKVDPADLARQQARLDALKQTQGASATQVRGKRFAARWLELDPKTKKKPEVQRLLQQHDRRVNEHNHKEYASRAPRPLADGAPGYVGSQACDGCHAPAVAWWREHAHGRAYATLQTRHKEFNLDCVSCHVTGYGRPGGAEVVQNEGLTDVGCESCHGPGSLHVANPKAQVALNVKRQVAQDVCLACHSEEHSDLFDYDSYRKRLIAPGHGLPPVAAAGAH